MYGGRMRVTPAIHSDGRPAISDAAAWLKALRETYKAVLPREAVDQSKFMLLHQLSHVADFEYSFDNWQHQ